MAENMELGIEEAIVKMEEHRICEGKADLIQPKAVFYNPCQEFNRDLSVCVLDTYLKNELWKETKHGKKNKEVKILDALSATGLRSIRYAKELTSIEKVHKIIANDLSQSAVEVIKKNIERNKVSEQVEATNEDAALLMYMNKSHEKRFVVVDIDPFGGAAPFLDGGVQSVIDGGLLMITCTDVAILCGNSSETCFAKYGSISLKSPFCHEFALRIVLRSIEASANRYGRYIVPLLSVSVDFYVRLFVQVFTGAAVAKFSASKTSHIYLCKGCKSFELQPIGRKEDRNKNSSNIAVNYKFFPGSGPAVDKQCSHCGHKYDVGGPVWNSNLHSLEFVNHLKNNLGKDAELKFKTYDRIKGILFVIGEELQDVPFFYSLDHLSRTVHCVSPKMKQVRSAILNAGFLVSGSHTNKLAIKTNAPSQFIWDMLRVWCKDNSTSITANLDDHDAGKTILKIPPQSKISFRIHENCEPVSKEMQLLRFQRNPEKYWGPKSKPGSEISEDQIKKVSDKRKKMDSNFKKKFPCKKFKDGLCTLGESCVYNHELANKT